MLRLAERKNTFGADIIDKQSKYRKEPCTTIITALFFFLPGWCDSTIGDIFFFLILILYCSKIKGEKHKREKCIVKLLSGKKNSWI